MKDKQGKPGRIGIRVKLMLVFVVLLSAVSGLFSLANLRLNSQETAEQARYTATQALQQTASFVENKCSAVIDILDIMAANETLIELIAEPAQEYPQTLARWWEDASRLNSVLFSMRSNKDIQRFHLYFSNTMSQMYGNNDFTLLLDVNEERWYRELVDGPFGYLWYPPGAQQKPDSTDMVTAVRKIPSPQNLKSFIGLIRADIPVELFQDVLDMGQFAPSAVLVLSNARGSFLCASENYRPEDEPMVRSLLAQSKEAQFPQGECLTLELDDTTYLAGTSPIARSDWTLSIMIPSTEVMALGIRTQQRILWIFLGIVPLTIPLAFWAARSSTNRILHLAASMRTFGKDSPSKMEKRFFGGDEIDELEHDYAEMLRRIESLMDEQYTLGIQNKNLELKALQAQINPHFLYNTLDLINMMGLQLNRPEIASLVKALAAFYRLSLGKGEDIVTVGKELDLVRAYLQIQNMRFDNCVNLEVIVPESLLEVPIPRIILQPLVENAVLHGILESEKEQGSITISGFQGDGRVVISIQDDGRGMHQHQADELVKDLALLPKGFPTMDMDDKTSEQHDLIMKFEEGITKPEPDASSLETAPTLHGDTSRYGVHNIDERLKLVYGKSYGIRVISAPGRGTVVHVVIHDPGTSA